MTDEREKFDWDKIQDMAKCQFDDSVRKEIEDNLRWHRLRIGDYAKDVSWKDFDNALKATGKALGVLTRTDFSRFQLEPIVDELATVMWFLEVMAQAPSEQTVSVKYFLYFRIWTNIGKAGVKLTQGKGIQNHRLSPAQKIFREICRQAGIEFTSDQALADVLKRALKAMSAAGAK